MLGKYLAGNNFKNALGKAGHIFSKGKIPVINYAIENSGNGTETFNEYKKLNEKINSNFRVAIKLSSFDFQKNIVSDVVEMFKENKIKILVDAEDNSRNDNYQNMINELIQEHNKLEPIIIKTYQMYRKDSMEVLENDLKEFKDHFLGTKLVRGAYWNSESRKGHLFTEKKETDSNYNDAIVKLFSAENKTLNVLATHNDHSMELGHLFNQEKNNAFEFGHLLGMKEKKYQNLLAKREKINVYLPYGPYHRMIPYLTRRLYENLDTLKHAV